MELKFTGERIVPEADNCEPNFAKKMYQEHIARYYFASQFIKKDTMLLDVGCGIGYGTKILAKQASLVTAFDISQEAIEHAKKYYSDSNINFVVENAENFVFNQKFELVTCFELIEHVTQQEKVLQNIFASLKEDGILVISTPRPLEDKRTHFHTNELKLNEFEALLKKYFKHITLFVENNHFASLVSQLDTLSENIVINSLDNQILQAKYCDYFICIASNHEIDYTNIQSHMILNNENYVKLLEKDVDILHRAEDSLKKEVDILRRAEDSLKNENEQLKKQIHSYRSKFLYKIFHKIGLI
jgi:2-polyprenyl-3-methyl-5-hydroxy-6-metoxy-1,4-benzoquinol methylase/FtsZ-binding cell division protein ZapB